MDIYGMATQGKLEAVQAMLNLSKDAIHTPDAFGNSLLMCAATHANLKLVKYLCEQGADLSWFSPLSGLSALATAACYGQFKIAAYLIAQGADINQTLTNGWDDSYQTALSIACTEGHLSIAKLLIENNAQLSPGDLVKSVESKNASLVKYLLAQGASINDQSADPFKISALAAAIRQESDDLAFFLLKQGADPNIKDSANHTCLSAAISLNNIPVIKALIRYGAKLNQQNAFGLIDHNCWDELEYALQHQQFTDTSYILSLSVHASNSQLGLQWLQKFPWLKAQVTTLFDEAVKLNRTDTLENMRDHIPSLDSEYTAQLMLTACRSGSLTALQWLMEQTGSPLINHAPATTNASQLALHCAIQSGKLNVVAFVLQQGVSTAASKEGILPFGLACKLGFSDIARLLIQNNAVGVSPSPASRTLLAGYLQMAVDNHHSEIAECLIELGADLEFRNTQNKRALERAIETDNIDLTRLLVEQGTLLPAPWEPCYSVFLNAIDYCGNGKLVKYLTESTPHREFLSHYGYSGLFLAVIADDTKQIQNLLAAGECVNQLNQWEQTPLMIAASLGHKDSLNILLEWKAETDICDRFHYGALTWAAIMGDQEDVVTLLLQAGADPNLFDEYGGSLLTKLAANGAWKSVRILLQTDANIMAESEWENSVLVEACIQGQLDIVKSVFDREKRYQPRYGSLPLDITLQKHEWEIVDYFLGQPIWKQNSTGEWSLFTYDMYVKKAILAAHKEKESHWAKRWQRLLR